MPSRCVYLFVKNEVLASGSCIRLRYNIYARGRADRIITILINLQIFRHMAQIPERQIHTCHRYYPPLFIPDRIGATDNHCPCARIVQVRFTPPYAVYRQTIIEPLVREIIVIGTTYQPRIDTIPPHPAAARFIPTPFVRIIIRYECYPGALNIIERHQQNV